MLCILVHTATLQDPDQVDVWGYQRHHRLDTALGDGE